MKNNILVIGVPRSGTTALMRYFATHFDINAISEPIRYAQEYGLEPDANRSLLLSKVLEKYGSLFRSTKKRRENLAKYVEKIWNLQEGLSVSIKETFYINNRNDMPTRFIINCAKNYSANIIAIKRSNIAIIKSCLNRARHPTDIDSNFIIKICLNNAYFASFCSFYGIKTIKYEDFDSSRDLLNEFALKNNLLKRKVPTSPLLVGIGDEAALSGSIPKPHKYPLSKDMISLIHEIDSCIQHSFCHD